MLPDNESLAIAELVYWSPALLLSLYVSYKHGFDRHLGWFFLILLAIARLISASCTIVYEQQSNPNIQVIVCAAVTASLGTSFLIQAVLGMFTRVVDGTPELLHIPSRMFKWLHIMLLVGIILSIVGGVDISNGGDDRSTGAALLKASTILFLVGHVFLGIGLVVVLTRMHKVPQGERRLIFAGLACWPFIFVRILYSILGIFISNGTFNYYNPNIWVRAFMAVAMEFIATGIILGTGLMTDKKRIREATSYAAPNYDATNMKQHPEQAYGQTAA